MPTSTIVQEARAREVPFTNNLLTNPGFEVWQRGAGPFTLGGFTADEWKVAVTAPYGTITQNATPKYGTYCLRCVSPAGSAQSISQGIESYKGLEGMWLTFSAWVRCSSANGAILFLSDYTTAQEQSFSPWHSGSGNWELLTVSKLIRTGLVGISAYPHSYAINVGISVVNSITADIDGAVCAVGYFPEGLMYVPPNVAQDVLRCERYYQTRGANWASAIGGSWKVLAAGTWFYVSEAFGTPMAATPTVTVTNLANDARFGTVSTVWCNSNKGFWTGRQSIATGNRGYFGDSWTAEVT